MRALFLLIFAVSTFLTAQIQYPVTPKVEQTDTYHGEQVPDPYRWLEDDRSDKTAEWVQKQNAVTFGYLDKIPFREKVRDRLTQLMNYPRYTAPFRAGKNWFHYLNDGLQNQSALYIMRGSLDAKPELFLDPNKLSTDGTTSLAGINFSKDGKYAAYQVSKAGSDWRDIYVMDVKTKKLMKDKIEWAKFTGITWRGNGFYYNRYEIPKDTGSKLSASNEFQKVYYHVLGTPQSKDELVMQDTTNPHMGFGIGLTEDERFMTLTKWQRNVNGNALFVRDMKKKSDWVPVLESFDDDIYVIDNVGDKLLVFTSFRSPNGRVVLVDPLNPSPEFWKDIIPQRPQALTSVSIVGNKLFAVYMQDVSHRVYVYSLEGRYENEIKLETLGTVSGFGGERTDQHTFYTLTSFTYPSVIYRYDLKTRQSTMYRKTQIDFNPDNFVTKQVFYPSKDGTKIPMFIVHRKGIKLDGSNPAWLYGYGGFNVSINPSFSASRLVWLEQGGIFAVANIRGGSEYGEAWHQAGMKLNKQNVFDDFIAAAEYLIKEKYTDPSKLAIEGRSNGGLLIGATINQRPDLFKVAHPAVGVMDMLRYQKFTIGWAWVNDYGSSDDSVQYEYLKRYSPVHNIQSTTKYPAVLVTTADHDDRVVPAHSFKYISTLQEKYKGPNPVLIRIETSAGHGAGKPLSKSIEEWADMYSFTWWNMGITPKYLLEKL